ncbi:hypothetical protein FRX31_013970 [Thalictrum thalictroides]|uniref:Uncharacterized protein n=1 Tax=Thalictrum thalictroides TaxID=46969 RepID=A0A7J6WGB6_THATH|nr:hypothetical protein FRX31_013970 [Thalictrum thalictroides]
MNSSHENKEANGIYLKCGIPEALQYWRDGFALGVLYNYGGVQNMKLTKAKEENPRNLNLKKVKFSVDGQKATLHAIIFVWI